MGRVLAHYLHEWHKQTPYAKSHGLRVSLSSMKESGKVPICTSVFCRVHLRPAAKKAGVLSRTGIAGVFTTFDTACRTGW